MGSAETATGGRERERDHDRNKGRCEGCPNVDSSDGSGGKVAVLVSGRCGSGGGGN